MPSSHCVCADRGMHTPAELGFLTWSQMLPVSLCAAKLVCVCVGGESFSPLGRQVPETQKVHQLVSS
jgi:hypothetical protein